MNEAPKKIWMVKETCWLNHDQPSGDIPYIRADIVDELVEALTWIDNRCPKQILEQEPHKAHWEAAHDAGACARAALKKLEESHD